MFRLFLRAADLQLSVDLGATIESERLRLKSRAEWGLPVKTTETDEKKVKHVTSPCFLWITGRWWSVWWSHCLVSPRSHTAPSPGNTHGGIKECLHMIKLTKWHKHTYTLTLMASRAVRRFSLSAGSVVCFTSSCSHEQTNYGLTGKIYKRGRNAAVHKNKTHTCIDIPVTAGDIWGPAALGPWVNLWE